MTAPLLSVVIPARNASTTLPRCLDAVSRAAPPATEVILVDDASDDDTGAIGKARGVSVLRLSSQSGPAHARNAGVAVARAPIVVFIDADVVIASDALSRIATTFAADSELAALFGSYDDAPAAGTIVSDYRNLLHHYVHQTAQPRSTTFWAGLGAIRRTVFDAVGGFDQRYRRPSIEDIELGARLAAAGHRIHLDRDLRGAHLKRWSFTGMVRTDVLERARPWTRLLLRDGTLPRDLNLQWRHRASGVLVWVIAGLGLAALIWPSSRGLVGVAAAIGVVALALLNLGFYRFLAARRGLGFTTAAFGLHACYYAYASATFGWCCAEYGVERVLRRRPRQVSEY
ncbi:glycosyltransferase family 2 protein [Luteitalea sp.]|uniref:glycosyltransferase n=1 Tax=Luteitalea sp. TaxID=2004800 RepID=UPI0025BF674A|nr:glycosyltransferase family A protein [Luteitalea sp.]